MSKKLITFLRCLIQIFIARPFARLIIGLDARGRQNLPKKGPAIIAANHNSHIDTLLLLCLFSSSVLPKVRPVAAADHFLKTHTMSWISRNIIGIIPIDRKTIKKGDNVLGGCKEALARGDILIVFPEGSRGKAEELSGFKTGIARLAEAFPEAPVIPIYLQGAGRVMPRGSKLFVPFNCSAIIGDAFKWGGNRAEFMDKLKTTIKTLSQDAPPLRWL